MKIFLEKVLNFAGSIPKALAFLGGVLSYMLATKFFVHLFFPSLPFFPYIYGALRPAYIYKPYYTTSIGIGVLGIFVCVILFVMILRNKNALQKGKYALIALLVGLFSHVLFFICTPQYVYNFHPQWLMYKSLDGKYIVNKDIYFYFVKKYGYSYSGYARFKTVEDNIEGLELAKKIKNPSLYNIIYENLALFGYSEVFKKYDDKTFMWYFMRVLIATQTSDSQDMRMFFDNYIYLKDIMKDTKYNDVQILASQLYEEFSHIQEYDGNQQKELIKKIYNKYVNQINNFEGIDKNIY